MNSKKLVITAFLVLILVVGGGSLLYTMYKLKDHQELMSDYNPDIKKIEKAKGQTITLTETQNGQRKWVLKMKEIKYNKDNSTARLTDIRGLVYGPKEEVLIAFNAPNGMYYKENSRIILEDGAKMVSPTAEIIISAPYMEWSAENDTVMAKGGIEMSKKNLGLSKAQTATFAMDFSKIQLMGNASSVIGGHSNTGAHKQ